jgi:hypothetical protein
MHQVLFKDTYDPSTIQALKAISKEQQQLEQELCSSIQQVGTASPYTQGSAQAVRLSSNRVQLWCSWYAVSNMLRGCLFAEVIDAHFQKQPGMYDHASQLLNAVMLCTCNIMAGCLAWFGSCAALCLC